MNKTFKVLLMAIPILTAFIIAITQLLQTCQHKTIDTNNGKTIIIVMDGAGGIKDTNYVKSIIGMAK